MKLRRPFSEYLSQTTANLNKETATERRELLLVTRDQRFLSGISYLLTSHGWSIQWATSVMMARDCLRCRPIPFVVYDWRSSADDWTSAIGLLRWVPEEPYIILAAENVDESLWMRAIHMHVYDVVARSLQKDHLVATLTFAWQKKTANRLAIAASLRP